MEVVTVPIPCAKQLHAVALITGPGITICKRSVYSKNSDCNSQNGNGSSLADGRVFLQAESAEPVAHKVVHLAQRENGEIQSWKVMM